MGRRGVLRVGRVFRCDRELGVSSFTGGRVNGHQCGGCMFYLQDRPKAEYGVCRRFPPGVPRATPPFPQTMRTWWCGEWAPAETFHVASTSAPERT